MSTSPVRSAGIALAFARYGSASILLLFVPLKWTEFEVQAIAPLVMNSPLLAWVARLIGMVATTRLIGTVEAVFAGLMLLRRWSPRACLLGSLGAVATFVTTLSFLATTPGMWSAAAGFPRPTGEGWFLLKDVLFLAAAIASTIEAARASRKTQRPESERET